MNVALEWQELANKKMLFVDFAWLLDCFCEREESKKEVKALLLFCRMNNWDEKGEGLNEQKCRTKGRDSVVLDEFRAIF